MLKKYPLFLLFILLINCKKEAVFTNNTHQVSLKKIKVIPIISSKSIAFDSTELASKSKQIKEFYRNNLFKTVWTEAIDRKELLELIGASELEGLNPEDYNWNLLKKNEKNREQLSTQQIIETDILLTEAFQKISNHFYNGKVKPAQLYTNWDIAEKNIKAIDLLQESIRNHTVAKTLDTLHPKHLVFHLLKKSLKAINEMPNDNFTAITIDDKINPNDTSTVILKIKKRLAYWKDYVSKDSLTEIYDSETVAAMKKFQKRHGLLADGIIGKSTITALNFSRTQRREQILANLERWRWFPRNLGNDYLIINIPDFELHAIKGTDTIRTHKIVVGREKRRTPVLSSKLSNLVINPTWTVPPTIIKEDLGPTAAKNRNYFAATGITIYNSKGQEVNPYNWNAEKSNNYRYVQKPGIGNALGLVKFNFPNGHLVYLHDTNHKEFFNFSGRSLSSGCIRVENPLELAYYILETDESVMNKKRVEKLIESKKTAGIPLKKSIFIHLLYWTAWKDENGFQFRNDIYNLDSDLYQKLRN